ncbi:MAG: calcium/sodium antiporter [Rehaibacterium terrae]|uniref:calcium/sodium antiporter n=1 Tax=Rehaibacterium terrae TaxID=1341696 RepID=UPI003919DEDE
MLIEIGVFAGGLLLLVLGADAFVRGAGGMALRFGISPFVVGLTLVGFGTSVPEMAVNMTAVLDGRTDLAVGNIVGSNIANVGLILGCAALVAPLTVQMRMLRVEMPLLLLSCALLWLLALNGWLGRFDGLLLLAGFVVLMGLIASQARSEPEAVQEELGHSATARGGVVINGTRIVLGFAGLLGGAHLMVDSAVDLARLWGIGELVIGLTIVAIGTSLPELAASLVAAWRGDVDIAVGNVVGSCLFNLLLILGASAALRPLPIESSMLWVEIPLMTAFALAIYPLARGDLTLGRRQGLVLLAAFAAFMGYELQGLY